MYYMVAITFITLRQLTILQRWVTMYRMGHENHYVTSGMPQHDWTARLCIDAGGNHFQHLLWRYILSAFGYSINFCIYPMLRPGLLFRGPLCVTTVTLYGLHFRLLALTWMVSLGFCTRKILLKMQDLKLFKLWQKEHKSQQHRQHLRILSRGW
jgi:hypothetical protein